ncbi:MAG: hypothetical protein IPI10_19310 [Bacteroidetes bacterium]|nr:hypothetical protein [Bacteroidota bacterium]
MLFTLGLNDGLSSLEFTTGAYAIRKNGQYVFDIDTTQHFPTGISAAKY